MLGVVRIGLLLGLPGVRARGGEDKVTARVTRGWC